MRTGAYMQYVLVLLAAAMLGASCQKELRSDDAPGADHSFTLRFKAAVDSQALTFGNTYTNTWGEQYTVSAFRFYLSHIKLINTGSGVSYPLQNDEHYLVNFADNNSTVLQLKAVPSKYDRIAFQLGVDSIRNVSGAQTGALDPANGMFWTGNTGYIMAKLEGNSPASAQVNNKFEYHIGGFAGPDHVLKQVTLLLPSGDVTLQAGKSTELTIEANVNAWFHSPFDLRLGVNPVCMSPGALARQISDNYIKMFRATDIVSQ